MKAARLEGSGFKRLSLQRSSLLLVHAPGVRASGISRLGFGVRGLVLYCGSVGTRVLGCFGCTGLGLQWAGLRRISYVVPLLKPLANLKHGIINSVLMPSGL